MRSAFTLTSAVSTAAAPTIEVTTRRKRARRSMTSGCRRRCSVSSISVRLGRVDRRRRIGAIFFAPRKKSIFVGCFGRGLGGLGRDSRRSAARTRSDALGCSASAFSPRGACRALYVSETGNPCSCLATSFQCRYSGALAQVIQESSPRRRSAELGEAGEDGRSSQRLQIMGVLP